MVDIVRASARLYVRQERRGGKPAGERRFPAGDRGGEVRRRSRGGCHLPRPGPVGGLPDPRPGAPRDGFEGVHPRPGGGDHPHGGRLRHRGGTAGRSHGSLAGGREEDRGDRGQGLALCDDSRST